MKFNRLMAAACLSLCFSSNARSAVLKGVSLPEQAVVQGKKLLLNGVAVRQKTVFNIDIYVAGLYLESPANSESAVLSSDQLKKLVMVFLHDASAKQITEAWTDGFRDNCGSHCEELQPQLARFNSLMTDIHRGQEVRLTFYPTGLTLASNGHTEIIEGRDFAKTVLSTFIGRKPGAESVKRGLLSARPAQNTFVSKQTDLNHDS